MSRQPHNPRSHRAHHTLRGILAGLPLLASGLGGATGYEAGRPAPADPPMLAFSRNFSDFPRFTLWNGSAWSASTAMPTIGGTANFLILRNCPNREEAMCVTQDDAKDINALFYNGTTWSASTELCISTGQTTNRPFDAAYEQSSGDGLVVYWKNASDQIGYRIYNGTALSAEILLSAGGANASTYMALFPQPRTDNIILLFENTTGGNKRLSAAVWNGSTWGNWTTLTTTSIASTSNECFAVAFEGISNHALCVYGEDTSLTPRYRTWNGSSWSSQGSLSALSAEPQWVRLAADPSSDRILVALQDANPTIYANHWTGSAWGPPVVAETSVSYSSRRQFDVVHERSSGRGLLVYSQSGQQSLRYRTWSGSAWSSELIGTDVGDAQRTVQARPGALPGQAFIAVQNDSADLWAVQWNGSTMSAGSLIETSLSGSSTEAFMLAVPCPRPRVAAWREVQP